MSPTVRAAVLEALRAAGGPLSMQSLGAALQARGVAGFTSPAGREELGRLVQALYDEGALAFMDEVVLVAAPAMIYPPEV